MDKRDFKMKNEKLRKQFEKVKKIAFKNRNESHKFDLMIDEVWGFSYSDVDFDSAIDTLDYGISNISFEDFVKEMNNYKLKNNKK